MVSFFVANKNSEGVPCKDSSGRAWRAQCAPVVDKFADWPNYAEHPYAMWAQQTLGRLTPNLRWQWPQLRVFVDIGANVGHWSEEIISRWVHCELGSSTY